MKAIWMTGKGGPEVLELREVAKPVPAAGEVLIRVAAAGLNRKQPPIRQLRQALG